MNLMTNFARYIARNSNKFVKRYHLGKIFKKKYQKSKALEVAAAAPPIFKFKYLFLYFKYL